MRFGGIPFDWVERHAAGAVRRGASFDRLLRDSWIDLRHGDGRDVISPAQHLLFSLNTVMSAGDAAHALARSSLNRLYPDIGIRLFLGCATLEGAILALVRLYDASSNPVRIQLRTEGEFATLSIHIDAPDPQEGALIEEVFVVWMFMHVLRFLGRNPGVVGVSLRDPFHFNRGGPHWGLGAPVSYGSEAAFWFPRHLLGRGPAAPAGANVMWECYELWFDLLREVPAPVGLSEFVRDGEFVRFSRMVRASGLSSNTLRRQLQTAGGAFRDVRQRTLAEAALNRLRNSHDSVESIAIELGYSDSRSLRRFLKSATGLTPQEVRERARLDAVQANSCILERIKVLGGQLSG
jgi:AraC-like DNA-binding protein